MINSGENVLTELKLLNPLHKKIYPYMTMSMQIYIGSMQICMGWMKYQWDNKETQKLLMRQLFYVYIFHLPWLLKHVFIYTNHNTCHMVFKKLCEYL